jgi:hypothetical protein
VAKLLPHSATLLGVSLLSACDWNPTSPSGLDERAASAVVFPSILGSYTGTVTARVRTSFGLTRNVSCPVGINIATQADDSFSGTVALQDTNDCNTETGTVNGSVGADGTLSLSADIPGGGANVFEDAAARSGCTLISSSGTFNGNLAGNVVTAAGTAVYECRRWLGFRAYVDVGVSATKI